VKYFIHTTGCKANQWDSYVISNKLKSSGLTSCAMPDADIIIINACTLTGGAEKDIRRFIHRCRDKNERAKIVLAGCHAQVYPDNNFGADAVLGQGEKFCIETLLDNEGRFTDRTSDFSQERSDVNVLPSGRTRFFFKIQDGCDKFCSYCVVPYARGKPRSRPAKEVLETLVRLKEKSIKEVVLTGIEIASYKDPETNIDLKGLLRLLETDETPDRIRISSIDPLYVDREFIEIVANSRKVARSLHIPLQSGSDKILERMGRQYTRARIEDVLEDIRERIGDTGVGMDVIVGFPEETEEAFEETYRFLASANIYYLHIFPYSARRGTYSSTMDGHVSESIKKERVRRLKKLDADMRLAFYRRFMDNVLSIIPEGKLHRGLYMKGFSGNYIPVCIPYQKSLENRLVKVRIKRIDDGLVLGESVAPESQ
jgi:threonylcarbamoyladenosine tRNA methylthiotransferase MtaB